MVAKGKKKEKKQKQFFYIRVDWLDFKGKKWQ